MPSDEQIAVREAFEKLHDILESTNSPLLDYWYPVADYIDDLTAALREAREQIGSPIRVLVGGGKTEIREHPTITRIDRLLAQWPEGGEG